MAERLIIQNFAGLNIDIELGRINIFIGPQASGKSVCIKCIACFQEFANSIINYASADSTLEEFENDFLDYFQTIFSLQTDKTFLFRYSLENQFIEIKYHKNGAHLSYSKAYSELFTEIRKIYSKPSTSGILGDLAQHIIAVPFLDRIRSGTNQFVGGQYLFIPSNRTHFSLLQQPGRPPLSIISDDPISSGFQRLYNSLRKQQSRRKRSSFPFYNTNKIVAGLIDKILRGTFTKEEKEDIIIHHNGTRSSLRQASSGQQEALPLLLVFEYLVSASSPQVPSTVYVEEPETHLHPKAQRDIVQLISAVYNIRKQPLQLFITTHTPYLLSSFNNLIYAGQLASKLKKNDSAGRKKLYAAVPKELHLNLADFRVYGLEDGKATLLIDEEFGLLMAHSIDSVSDIIADQFGDLMALDPANKPSAAN